MSITIVFRTEALFVFSALVVISFYCFIYPILNLFIYLLKDIVAIVFRTEALFVFSVVVPVDHCVAIHLSSTGLLRIRNVDVQRSWIRRYIEGNNVEEGEEQEESSLIVPTTHHDHFHWCYPSNNYHFDWLSRWKIITSLNNYGKTNRRVVFFLVSWNCTVVQTWATHYCLPCSTSWW